MNRIAQILSFLEKNQDDCFLNHALALEFLKIKDVNNAKLYFEKNLRFDPGYIPTYYHLGKLLELMGQIEDAVKMYQEGMIIAKNADDVHAYSELRTVYEELTF